MDFESLNIFCAVAAELRITRAASRLCRVQSNVTTGIQQLEAHVGVGLFVRTNKRLGLSTAGDLFLDYAQRMLALEEEARHVVTGDLDSGILRVGCMESTAASRLHAVLAVYHAHYPTTRLKVTTGPSRDLLEQVHTRRLDCAFLALPPSTSDDASLADVSLVAEKLWHEELLLLAPPSEVSATSAQNICSVAAAFAQGCSYRAIAEEMLGIPESPGWQTREMGSYHAMIACVSPGACVAVLPKSVLEPVKVPAGLKTLPAGQVGTFLLWRAGYDVPAFRNLQNHMKEVER